MKTANAISCLKIGKKELQILVMDLQTKKNVWRREFTYDFEIYDDLGVIINPNQISSLIRNIFSEYGLPKSVRVSLSFEYLNMNCLTVPSISGDELHQIIIDEAKHQSVFSFTSEKVAVAYQMLRDTISDNGLTNKEVFAVTTFQSIIDQIIEVFKNTDLILESISPAFWGLKHCLPQFGVVFSKPFISVLVSDSEAELYIWKGEFPDSGHYIGYGIDNLQKLNQEIVAAIDYFNRNIAIEDFISRIVITGKKCEVKLSDEFKIDYKFEIESPDLFGLALLKGLADFNYLAGNTGIGITIQLPVINKLWPLIAGGVFLINFLGGWNLTFANQRLSDLRNETLSLRSILNTKTTQLAGLNVQSVSNKFPIHRLLEQVRRIVTGDMMFDKLTLDLESQNMQVEGFCLNQSSLSDFLEMVSRLDGVKSINEIESGQQIRTDLTGYAFRFNVSFSGDFYNEK